MSLRLVDIDRLHVPNTGPDSWTKSTTITESQRAKAPRNPHDFLSVLPREKSESGGQVAEFGSRATAAIPSHRIRVDRVESDNVIQRLDGVLDVTVFGEPKFFLGEIVCARVQARSGVDRVELEGASEGSLSSSTGASPGPVKVEWSDGAPSSQLKKKARRFDLRGVRRLPLRCFPELNLERLAHDL